MPEPAAAEILQEVDGEKRRERHQQHHGGDGGAFARAVGEYGSVIFVAGNLPYVSEIAPLLIVIKLTVTSARNREAPRIAAASSLDLSISATSGCTVRTQSMRRTAGSASR
jgi:ABC-type sulfate transport system permease component